VTSLAALHTAHDALERAAVAARGPYASPQIGELYHAILRRGEWFTAARQTLDANADAVQQRVSGTVRLTLFEGNCAVNDVRAASSPIAIVLARATSNDS
jgi:argininosuccinate synthase